MKNPDSAPNSNDQFPLTEARNLVKDLFVPNRLIYWLDFLFHIILGWGAFLAALRLPLFSLLQLCTYIVAVLALYRAVIFIHELAHLPLNTFKFFRLIWNITCGFPLMVPSFTYHGVHNEHHRRDNYGTGNDGEYLPFGADRPYKILVYLSLIFILPLLFAGRFVVLTPLSYLNRNLRQMIWKRVSSLTIDLSYRRPGPAERDDRTWTLQEFFTFAYGATAIALVIAGVLSYQMLVLWYLIAVFVFLLNSLRTLAAHAYRNSGSRVMDFEQQYLDSVNVPGNLFFTALWAPVGLRYHATHHLFPSMPYHALGTAHQRLVDNLSDNTLYLETTRASLWDALRRLWEEASQWNRSAYTSST